MSDVAEIKTYAIIWKYDGYEFVIDVDDEEHAHDLARHIAETPGRKNVRVIVSSVEISDSTLNKISERIASRLKDIVEREKILEPEERMHDNH
jgi:hypothetical protein